MPERASIFELGQIGIESVYGTSVAATKRLASLGVDLSPEFETTRLRPPGYIVDTIVAPMREWAGGDLSGYPAYNELPYVFNSLLKKITPTTTTGVSVWDWVPSSVSAETVDSWTIEQGDAATRAHKVTGGVVTDFNLSWTRTGDPDMGGTVLAQAFVDGITPTAALTLTQPIPVLPTHIDVYADATWAGAGTTKLTRAFSGAISIGGMRGALWVLNTSNASFVTIVQQPPDVTFTLVMEADSAGGAYLTQMRAGTPVFLQIKATGPTIAGGTPTTPHSMKLTMATAIDGPPAYGDTDGVRTVTWPFRAIVDTTSSNWFRAQITNGVATL